MRLNKLKIFLSLVLLTSGSVELYATQTQREKGNIKNHEPSKKKQADYKQPTLSSIMYDNRRGITLALGVSLYVGALARTVYISSIKEKKRERLSEDIKLNLLFNKISIINPDSKKKIASDLTDFIKGNTFSKTIEEALNEKKEFSMTVGEKEVKGSILFVLNAIRSYNPTSYNLAAMTEENAKALYIYLFYTIKKAFISGNEGLEKLLKIESSLDVLLGL